MRRTINKLSAKQVESLRQPGWHGDGGGLWLRIFNNGSKRWIFTWERNKRRHEMGFGPLGTCTLAKARAKAEANRGLLAAGLDPLETKREEAAAASRFDDEDAVSDIAVPEFRAFARAYIDGQAPGWKAQGYARDWRNSLDIHGSTLGQMSVHSIEVKDVLAVLQPIWTHIPRTAGLIRHRIEKILDAAKASGHINSPWENPARWRGNLIHMLPKQNIKRNVQHRAAIPYEDIPRLFDLLRKQDGMPARALELTILCATRSCETLGARWREFDLSKRIWTIPADRMKMGIVHQIPLSDYCLKILQYRAKNTNCDPGSYVFPGRKPGRPFGHGSMRLVLVDMEMNHYTVHGMRSAFRDYMGEMTEHSESVIEMALAHQVGDETVRAYRRGSAFRKRTVMMADWERYLLSQQDG